MTLYLDAGTTYSKIIAIGEKLNFPPVKMHDDKAYYILPSSEIRSLGLKFKKSCGHMQFGENTENEIIALAQGAINKIEPNSTVLDLGSRDAKWIRFKNGKFKDMDWNTACASSTGATVEMLMKFYNLETGDLKFNEGKYNVTCGIFGFEKIMDDISKGEKPSSAVSKFIHGVAFNAWNFAKKPEKIYLSGGFCDNECFVQSLSKYCEVIKLGRFVLVEGLIKNQFIA